MNSQYIKTHACLRLTRYSSLQKWKTVHQHHEMKGGKRNNAEFLFDKLGCFEGIESEHRKGYYQIAGIK